MDDLYRDIILDHYRHPRRFGPVEHFPLRGEARNALCGDELQLGLALSGDRVSAMGFHGRGCAVCMAAASLCCERLPGTSAARLALWPAQLDAALKRNDDGLLPAPLEPLTLLRAYPARHRCVLLMAEALAEALAGRVHPDALAQ
ncbi:iron-sulfur cluster assembly scaffold protein [Alkalilimnicola ehrlichii MLHE-1]|uniref:Nitrogen-fixing NifU domain protein n=1 Tax=Alkalilimnicola ehrlichii (strain ATCC BAA-1101 / DSM 17681 / MLHE-1) TaxID=187272 RepID=Q0A8C0_ALKEH|nr:iron-sulfur cluster assembly scaffold protein [Alkalilimnicola ehrlichii]ABI56917.1 nitrogen-fixing NifU domain protein [Alkalilimnicola ehrlichii MLHE-1]